MAVQLRQCTYCGAATDPPVVKIARRERSTLLARAGTAEATAGPTLTARVLTVVRRTRAVVNTSTRFAGDWLRGDTAYLPYARLVAAEVRSPAALDRDRDRTAAEALLYGDAAGNIAYAALTDRAEGLWSYGEVALVLANDAVAARSVVLEENSYDFLARHGVTIRRPAPEGYLGVWGDRERVVLAKLGPTLASDAEEGAIGIALLSPAEDRRKDQFVEVHIDGAIAGAAVANYAFGPSHPKDDEERYLRDRLEQSAAQAGVAPGWTP